MNNITIHKRNHLGEEKLSWPGRVLKRTATSVVLEASFTRGPMALGYVTLKPGDTFIEYFYTDRWYNIYELYDVDDGAFKGWYCNITRPAVIEGEHLYSDDLALDYFVQPSGKALVLDEDEFAALALSAEETQAACAALDELRGMATEGRQPFARLSNANTPLHSGG